MKTTSAAVLYSQQHQLDPNPTAHIDTSTPEYLHTAFLLYEYKKNYSKRDYLIQLEVYGWDKGSLEEKRALKIGKNFRDFASCPQQLAPVPITILLNLCSKQYKPIIDLLANYPPGGLTCQIVLDLIEERKALLLAQKEQQLKPEEEKPSVWKRTRKGQRYCEFGPVWEDDFQTGTLAQKLIDEHGMIPQQILREAVADYYTKINQEKEQSEIETAESMVIVDLEIPPQAQILPFLDEEPIQEVTDSVDSNEQVIICEVEEFANDENSSEDNSLTNTNSATEQQPVKDEEVFILVEKLKSATSYYQIRGAVYHHLGVKDKAWEQLSTKEKSRIEKLLPQEVKVLNQARESGLIIDYYELETGIFQIFVAGENKPVSVTKSSIVTWLKEQERIDCVTI